MKFISLFLCLLSCTMMVLPANGQASKDYSEAFRLIEVWLEAQKDFENLPGITAAVIKNQEVLWTGGFGKANVSGEIEAAPRTIYSICSISKLFTAIAIMKLYDEEKLRLDDKVSDLLPWYNLEQQYPESGPITVRSLLTHSSGLPREAAYPYWTGPDFPFPSQEAVKSKLGEQQTLYPAATYFQYSNLGLTLLGEIIEEVSGQPYETYIQENILTPLALSDTRTELPKSQLGSQLAIGYSALNREGKREAVNFFQAEGIQAAAGFSSNVLDLGKFASWQLRLLGSKEVEILRPSTLNYMHRVHWTDPDWETTWGLGFSVSKSDEGGMRVGHGGSCPGYRTQLSIDPKNQMAYVVMINANGTSPGKYEKGIREIMKKMKPPEDEANTPTVDLNDFSGYYSVQPWWSEMYVAPWHDKLVVLDLPTDAPGDNMTFYQHIEGDTFRRVRDNETLGETFVFERNQQGYIISVQTHNNNYTKLDR